MRDTLKELINQSPFKRISYSQFIEAALYNPENGYYMKSRQKIGRAGDFITTPYISPTFAKVIAQFFSKVVTEGGLPPLICEIGGGDGRFAKGVIEEWRQNSPKLFEDLRYYLVEKSGYHREKQKTIQKDYPQLRFFEDLNALKDETERFQGIVFSNEWFDALPVEVVEQVNGSIFELWITLNDEGEFSEVFIPLENERIKHYLKQYGISLSNGQRMEIPLAMLQKLEEIHSLFHKGLIVTIDYGYTFLELNDKIRRQGSLRGYFRHQMITNPLMYAGEMDLTAHIHFDSFIEKGKELGAELLLLKRQDEFLLSIGILDLLKEHHDSNPFSETNKHNRDVRSLIMDNGMSSRFHVIIQQKNFKINKEHLSKHNNHVWPK